VVGESLHAVRLSQLLSGSSTSRLRQLTVWASLERIELASSRTVRLLDCSCGFSGEKLREIES